MNVTRQGNNLNASEHIWYTFNGMRTQNYELVILAMFSATLRKIYHYAIEFEDRQVVDNDTKNISDKKLERSV
jgi:hypothetical protein